MVIQRYELFHEPPPKRTVFFLSALHFLTMYLPIHERIYDYMVNNEEIRMLQTSSACSTPKQQQKHNEI